MGIKKIEVDQKTQIISSLPLSLTVRLLGHKSDLKFRGVRTIYIAIKRPRVLPKNVIGFTILPKI